MIRVQNGQSVKDNMDYVVVVPTGDYEPVDLLQCARKGENGEVTCMFQTQCVVYGNMVYQQDVPLTAAQVRALENGTPIDEVINNKMLMVTVGVIAGDIVGTDGVLVEAQIDAVPDTDILPEDELDQEPDDEPDEEPKQNSNPNPKESEDQITPVDISPDLVDPPLVPLDATTTSDISIDTSTTTAEIIDEALQEKIIDSVTPTSASTSSTTDGVLLNMKKIKTNVAKAVVKSGKKIAMKKIQNIRRKA